MKQTRRTDEEMQILVDKVKPMRQAGVKNREICKELGISNIELAAVLRRMGVYKRTYKSENDEIGEGIETLTIKSMMTEKLASTSGKAQVKTYVDKKSGKKYSDVSEFYGL